MRHCMCKKFCNLYCNDWKVDSFVEYTLPNVYVLQVNFLRIAVGDCNSRHSNGNPWNFTNFFANAVTSAIDFQLFIYKYYAK